MERLGADLMATLQGLDVLLPIFLTQVLKLANGYSELVEDIAGGSLEGDCV